MLVAVGWVQIMQDTQAFKLLLLLAVVGLLLGASSAANQDPWQVLGVRRSATKGEITRAFRRLSKEWHPDKNRSPEATQKFQEISAAYDVLTDPTKAKTLWEASENAPKGSGFTATFGTVQYVLDLDPNRLRELLTAWTTDWASKNWETFGPLWQNPVDQSVCWCMENAWRLPKLTEPISKLAAQVLGKKHREGTWRAWRLSGSLLEFSAWSSRQAPCLQRHLTHSTSTEQDVLAQLQQQLSVRRKARQAAVESAQRRQKRVKNGDSSTDNDNTAAAGVASQRLQAADADSMSWQGCALWGSVLATVASWCLSRQKTLLFAPVVAAAAVVYGVSRGLLLPDEAAVQQLAAIFGADGTQATMLGVAFVLFSLAVGVLLPLLLASAAFIMVTWVWAAASTLTLAFTPVMSQTGLALWLAAQVYFMTGPGDLIKSVLVVLFVGFVGLKAPKILKWWFTLLTAPVVLVLAFVREGLRDCGLWPPAAPKVAPAAEAAAAQQAAAAAAAERAASAAGQARTATNGDQHSQQQSFTAAAAAAADSSPEHANKANRSKSRSSTSSSRNSKKQRRLLPDGAWWPRSFAPVDLAVTCYWYTSLLGWQLASWALGVAAISCKLTVLSVLFAVTSAAFGAPIGALTLQNAVRLLMLRGGLAVGLLWKLRLLLWQQLTVGAAKKVKRDRFVASIEQLQ